MGNDFPAKSFYERVHPAKVSLMIKSCAQDGRYAERLIRHIIGQLGQDARFLEKYVCVDPKKSGFLRPYEIPDWEYLLAGLTRLQEEGIIDYWRASPTEPREIRDINRRWFACETDETHSVTGVPVAPQLYGFELAKGDYLLQTDIDVMIGRRDIRHDYLSDMLFALDASERNISVSFNIPHDHIGYIPYSAPEPGGFVPEVRFGLLDLKKLFALRPLPNGLEHGKLKLTWYRSLYEKQKVSKKLSLRGGDGRSFFIHPMNSIKSNPTAWMDILQKVEQGSIPCIQYDRHDLVEDEATWKDCQSDNYHKLILPLCELLEELREHQSSRLLVIIRHGQRTAVSKYARLHENQAASLSIEGENEVLTFARGLPTSPHRILTSPIPRCRQTADLIKKSTGNTACIVELPELLGGKFHAHEVWLEMKRRFGWSQLVAKWLKGELSGNVVTAYRDWIETVIEKLRIHAREREFTLVITQGYLNTAFCYHLTGRMEFRGGPLYGFIWPAGI